MFMKNHVYQKPSQFSRFVGELLKNVSALFESSDKKEFQRLKNFIAS